MRMFLLQHEVFTVNSRGECSPSVQAFSGFTSVQLLAALLAALLSLRRRRDFHGSADLHCCVILAASALMREMSSRFMRNTKRRLAI